jgi:two-component system, sensor histidine kinase
MEARLASGSFGTAEALRVLVVEDDDDSREMLGELLSALGHEGLSAANVEEALRHARESRPGFALIDLGLPDVDGYEVARRLRAAVGESIRLVALTGYSDHGARLSAEAAGFDDFVVKPVLPEALDRLLRGFADPPRSAQL